MTRVSRTSNVDSKILHWRWTDYQKKMKNANIEDYFGILPQKNDTISFALTKESNHCVFTVKYVTQNTPNHSMDIVGLPKELCDLIATFASKMIQIKFKITYPETYPFEPPIWSLMEEEDDMDHLPKAFVLKDHYQDIVDRHNSQYNDGGGFNWTPAIDIRTDILSFIEKINHFELISQYFE